MGKMKLSMVCVAFQRPVEIKVLIASILAQTMKDFELIIIHDGEDGAEQIKTIVEWFDDSRIIFRSTPNRFDDFGHSLREIGTQIASGEFVGHTNDDNYYAPVYFEKMVEGLESTPADFAYCDMIHSHQGWQLFSTEPRANLLDAGGWVCRKSFLPEKWGDKSFNGDGVYINQIMERNPRTVKVPGVLFVHN